MQKAGILFTREQSRAVLAAVQELGIFEVIAGQDEASPALPEEFSGVDAKIADLAFVARYLEESKADPKNLREKLLGQRVEADEMTALKSATNDFTRVIDACENLQEREGKVVARKAKIAELQAALTAWHGLNIPLDFPRETANAYIEVGTVEEKDFGDFAAEIETFPLAHLYKVSASEQHVYVLLVFAKSIADEITSIVESYRFAHAEFEGAKGTVKEEQHNLQSEEKQLAHDLHEITQQKQQLAKEHLREVKLAHDALLWQRDKKQAIESAAGSEQTIFVQGWVPRSRLDELKAVVAKVTDQADVMVVPSGEDDIAPSELGNTKALKPFEIITRFFGMPKGGEMDPTPFVTPFFVIFFGFCLTDAGYGFLLAATFAFILYVFPLGRDLRASVRLLMYCGFSTIVMGILFGGYFGLTTEQLPFLVNPADGYFYGQVFDPLNNLIPNVMVLAYGLGLFQLLLGVVLSGIIHVREGRPLDTVFITLPTFLAVIFTILWAMAKFGVMIPSEYASVLGMVPLALLAVLVFSMGSGNIFVRPLLGILIVANEIIGWASIVLSYSRLFALGLATGIIAMSFNQIAGMAYGALPILLGIPAMLLIILLGHTLNLGLNFIGALVHTARLQFVEFFGRYFEGGGKAFTPLKRQTVYLFDPSK